MHSSVTGDNFFKLLSLVPYIHFCVMRGYLYTNNNE